MGTIVIVLSMVVVVVSEGGRRWGERRLEGRTEAAADVRIDEFIPVA